MADKKILVKNLGPGVDLLASPPPKPAPPKLCSVCKQEVPYARKRKTLQVAIPGGGFAPVRGLVCRSCDVGTEVRHIYDEDSQRFIRSSPVIDITRTLDQRGK